MTALIIILCIIAFIVLLLFMPVRLHGEYDADFKLSVGYLFFKFTVFPQKEKKKKKKNNKSLQKSKEENKKTEQKDNKSFFTDIIKEKGIGGVIGLLKEAVKILKGFLSSVTDHIIIKKLYLKVVIASDNAADTAVQYGYACSGIYPLISFICAAVKKYKKTEITIYPDFNASEVVIEGEIKVSIKLLFLLKAAVIGVFKSIKLLIKAKLNQYV